MEIHKLTDEVLINLYKNGNSKAFETLLLRHKSELYRYIFSYIHNRELTDDFFQETVIKTIQTIQQEKYQESGKFLAWAKRIAHNLIIDYFWDEKKKNLLSIDVEEYDILNNYSFSEKSIEDVMFNDQVLRDVVRLIDFLPTPQQSVVRMRFFQGLNFNEIAKNDDISVNTALGRMRYAILNMRRIVSEKEMDLELK